MNNGFKALRRQSGAALVVLLALLLLVSAAILLDRLSDEANASTAAHTSNSKALADAKAALIAWAATYPPSAARESTVGTLPYPDRDGDGVYDGLADCDALGVNDLVLVGRLPRAGEDVASCGVANPLSVDLRDGAGEPLWYAVSRNVLAGVGVAGGPINPDMGSPGRMAYPWIKLKDAQGNDVLDPNTGLPLAVAAVIFAPGSALAGQNRSGTASAANYLDNITIGATTYDNADADGCPDNTTAPCGSAGEEFVVYPNPQSGDTFNDELAVITVGELMRAAEKRVLGDMALILDQFRAAGWNTANDYPWLRAFRDPRAGTSGTATGGSTNYVDDSGADFVADGIQVGDVVIHSSSGSGVVTGVTPTRINFTALLGGLDVDFGAGENYQVQPAFEADFVPPLTRKGQLPVHLPGEIFRTSFTANWDLADIDDYYEGTAALQPAKSDVQTYNVTVQTDDGRCMWTEANRVDCYGEQIIPNYFRTDLGYAVDQRLIQVQFSFPGRDNTGATVPATITPPTFTDVRRRSVSIDSDGSPPVPMLVPVAAPNFPQDLYPPAVTGDTWTIRVTDTLAGNSGTTLLVIDADTDGDITVSGIRYDISVVYDNVDDARDEVPEWFAENNWHHFLFAAFTDDVVAGGDDDCSLPAVTCLNLNVAGVAAQNDIGALLLAAGMEWTNQDRGIGDCDGDGGGPLTDPTDDSFLCAYFDGDTSVYDVSVDVLRHGANTQTVTADFFSRDIFATGFNDQIRVIQPPPP